MLNPMNDWDSASVSWDLDLSRVSRHEDTSFSKPAWDSPKKDFKFEFPMTLNDVLDNLKKYIHPFEIEEIKNYPNIYFFPILDRKMPNGMEPPRGTRNNNFDNEAGEY